MQGANYNTNNIQFPARTEDKFIQSNLISVLQNRNQTVYSRKIVTFMNSLDCSILLK